MVFTAGKSAREFQRFKDKEEFFGNTGFGTTGLGIFFTDQSHVKDVLIANTGGVKIYYNLGVSGVTTAATSTSGVPLDTGAERVYNEVGFDWLFVKPSGAGAGSVAVHVVYDTR